MKTSIYLRILLLCIVSSLSAKEPIMSPYAAPATKVPFEKATIETFPFSTFVFREKEVRISDISVLRICAMDLDGDGTKEWIVAIKEEHPHGQDKVLFFVERDGKLILILKADPYFTLIPKRDSYPDIETWHRNAMFSHRQRWTYVVDKRSYRRMWVDHYEDDVLAETTIDKPD